MPSSHGKSPQNSCGGNGAKMLSAVAEAPVFRINQGEYTERVRGALRLAFVNERNPVKKLAEVADTSTATAKNWLEGRSTPYGLHFIRLLAAIPEFQAEVRRLAAMQSNLDPAFEREMHGLIASFQRMKETQA